MQILYVQLTNITNRITHKAAALEASQIMRWSSNNLYFLHDLPYVFCSTTWAGGLAVSAKLKRFKSADAINMIHMCAAQPSYAL